MFKGLLRDINKQKGWLIAIIILVALSAGIYSSFRSIYDSAINSVDNARRDLNHATVKVVAEPSADISTELKAINGVDMVSPVFSEDVYSLINNKRVRGYISAVAKRPRVGDYQIIDG